MPNMDGTGPRLGGQRIGAGSGWRNGTSHSFGGCRCGIRYCYQYTPDEKETLTVRKEELQRNLASIEKRLETL